MTQKVTEITEKLIVLNDTKLIDVVKNYRQYGYDESIRNSALTILKSRGIDEDYLKLTGNFSNHNYDRALDIASSYSNNSKTAFLLYLSVFVMSYFTFIAGEFSESFGWIFLILTFSTFILFNVYFMKSMFNHVQFYKSVGKELGVGDIIIYLFIGLPLYFFLHFYYKKQMKEEIKLIK
jgi:hypothetical protein